MITRHLGNKLLDASRKYPVITLTGPRQSGKTTLVRAIFPEHAYLSLEDPDNRTFAIEDSRGFLNQFRGGAILDEVQRTPDLISYLQSAVDEDKTAGRFILTGSQNFLLLEAVSQSLAGRSAIFHLLPFSRSEMQRTPPMTLESIGHDIPVRASNEDDLLSVLHTGFYPRIHDLNIEAQDWLANYYQAYVERDVRTVLDIGDLETFTRFVRLCAGRCGQLLNVASLGADCGISHMTAKRWLSVLEASFVVYLLRPHHKSFNKRLIKSPKLYFLDTGLLCYLLRITTPSDLAAHAMRGAVFETFVVTELLKAQYNQGRNPNIYFWRESTGREIDFLIDHGPELTPVEAKSGQTIASDSAKTLAFWRTLPEQENAHMALVYGGDRSFKKNDVTFYSWRDWL